MLQQECGYNGAQPLVSLHPALGATINRMTATGTGLLTPFQQETLRNLPYGTLWMVLEGTGRMSSSLPITPLLQSSAARAVVVSKMGHLSI